MSLGPQTTPRVRVDGKFFRLGDAKFYLRGLTYGPFAPNARKETFPGPEQTERDFRQIQQLGANLLRVYDVPPRWLLDLAGQHALKVLIDIPWPSHLCFLDSPAFRQQAHEAVRRAVNDCRGHSAVFAYSVANEIPAEIVRWSGADGVEAFIDELVSIAKSGDPECLCTFTSFPSTEYLRAESIDFLSLNVYLHEKAAFERYLARLQMSAGSKPLVLAELGMDSMRETEACKCAFLSWQIESVFRRGLAGAVVFSYTDDWFRGGMQIEDWSFGITTRDRCPKDSFQAVQRVFAAAPRFPLPRYPKVSVIVASYNGADTLRRCLVSLSRLNYPDYEVILVDDGSTDNTAEITKDFPTVHAVRHDNKGLSAARNTGLALASGEIVAFTDADCRADEDWLYYLVGDLLDSDFIGIGGPNLLPPEDSLVAAAVMVSPGGPAHVMLSDREAEHLPGCNMAFYRRALQEIGGFDPTFHKAGDDVDVCWRLQQRGYKIGFSPAAFVWHYRRSTIQAYLRQQNGYGEAEALLLRKHPEYFNLAGRSMWNGRIYSPSPAGVVLRHSVIYHGRFGAGLFQRLYSATPAYALMFCTSLEYHALITVPLLVLALALPWLWPLVLSALLLSLSVCTLAAVQAELPRRKQRFWSRPLVAALFFLQPIERGLARYRTLLRFRPSAQAQERRVAGADHLRPGEVPDQLCFWSEGPVDREALLVSLIRRLTDSQWHFRTDTGWTSYDLEILESRWSRLQLVSATERLDRGRMNLRCRLRTFWSLQAKLFFWGMFALELVLVSLLAPLEPWIWMLLLTLPVLAWFLEHEQSVLRRATADLVEEVAREQKLLALPPITRHELTRSANGLAVRAR